MFQMSKQNDSIVFKFSSKTELVHQVIENCQNYLKGHFSNDELVELSVILREVLLNAVRHGNNSRVDKLVRCVIEHLSEKQLKIVVKDQGDGFDLNHIDNISLKRNTNGDPIKRQGYLLIRALSQRIEFNNVGNGVTIYFDRNNKYIE